MLALAHRVEQLVARGEVDGYAVVARALGLTRARMTQVMNMLLPRERSAGAGGLRGSRRHGAGGVSRAVREAEWGPHPAPPGALRPPPRSERVEPQPPEPLHAELYALVQGHGLLA